MGLTVDEGFQILVVDDDEGLAALFEAVLEDAGYPVTTAHSGQEAVQCVSEREPALILLDIRMPGMDGIDTFREIRRRSPGCPVIFMTGYAEPPVGKSRWRGSSVECLPDLEDPEALMNLVTDATDDCGALLLPQDPERFRLLEQALRQRGFDPQVVTNAHEAIFHFEGRPRQVVMLEETLLGIPPVIVRDLNPGVVRLLLSHLDTHRAGGSIPPTPFLAKPFRPNELLQTVALAATTA